MRSPQITPLRTFFRIAVFHQCGCHLCCIRPQIQSHERTSAHHLAPCHKLVGSKLIRLKRVPRLIENTRAVFPRADSVEPVVGRDKIATWIADDGHAQAAYFVHHILTESIRISQTGTRFVDSLVDGSSQMLEE